MLDRAAIALLRPGLDRAAHGLVRTRIRADHVTIAGFAVGLTGAAAIAYSHFYIGLALLLASRFADGLDGALARLTTPTDRGAFLDITLDFIFYASVPLAFALADPPANALPAAVLLATFIGTGSSFLAFAALAAQRGMTSATLPATLPNKGIYYLGGLTEATETLICFMLMCLWPQHFPAWAFGFAAMCLVTTVTRLAAGWRALK